MLGGELLSAAAGGKEYFKSLAVTIRRAPTDNDCNIKAEWFARGVYGARPIIDKAFATA